VPDGFEVNVVDDTIDAVHLIDDAGASAT